MEILDAVIVGGGHNGLICAAYLAKAGKTVFLLERRDILGGACNTEEVWPGYHVSTAGYLCSLLHPDIVRDLDLKRYGFEVYRRECGGFAPFADGTHLLFYPNADKTRNELEQFCPEDVDAYFKFEADVELAANVLEPFFLEQSPTLGKVADAFQNAGIDDLFEQFFVGSVRTLLESRFRNEKLMAVLATDGLIGTAAGPSDSGTAYVLLHHYMGRVLGERGLWGYVRGGMGNVSLAAAKCAEAHGAQIRLSTEVNSFITKDDRVIGVVLSDGREIYAHNIITNSDPVQMVRMLGAAAPSHLSATIDRWQGQGVSCKINMAVSELPNFTAMPGTIPGPQHFGTVHLAPSMDFLNDAWNDCKSGYPSKNPMIEVYIQTATDSSLAPEGKHILSCFTQYYPRNLADGLDHALEAELYADRVIAEVAKFAPNVPASILHRQILTPFEIEQRFGITGGHIFHGDILPPQMFGGRSGQRGALTSVNGLYLCGSGAWPGGCVTVFPDGMLREKFLPQKSRYSISQSTFDPLC